jgi:TPR repeat protein
VRGLNGKTCSLLLAFLMSLNAANATFVCLPPSPPSSTHSISPITRQRDSFRRTKCRAAHNEDLCNEIVEEIKSVARDLWKGGDEMIPALSSTNQDGLGTILEGEAKLRDGVTFQERAEYFRTEALKGCPKSQHSYGLLLWSGFAGVQRDAVESAKFHAAAASQKHLDGMAILGGCLRTGTGVKQNVALGLKIIEYCASTANPTGVNKRAALLESNQDDVGAVQLYEDCVQNDRVNALLLFNLGWCLVNGQGVSRKERDRGISLWKSATRKAPDEGSEEASWYLYEEYKRDNPKEAQRWLYLAEELGYHED